MYEHTSTLKFLEAVFGLPTLASVNYLFDQSTPGGPNNEAAGGERNGPVGPATGRRARDRQPHGVLRVLTIKA